MYAVDAELLEDIADQFPQALSIKGPNPQDLRRSKATPIVFLLLANDATRMDVLDVFIKKGADLNSQETYYGRTFLHGLLNNLIFGNFDWLKMFETALRAKADPDIKDLSGDSVRSIAKARKRQDLLDYIERYAPEH